VVGCDETITKSLFGLGYLNSLEIRLILSSVELEGSVGRTSTESDTYALVIV
jgi:hypothetical protein